jgi:glycosyltransferase A (GT-A) superfamily protein (DUF2064 family)
VSESALDRLFNLPAPSLPDDDGTAAERALIEPIIGVRGARVHQADRRSIQLMSTDNRVLWTGDLRSESIVADVARALGHAVVVAPLGTQAARMGSMAYSSRGVAIWPPAS